MEILYFWIREHRNIKETGFNLSSKVLFNTVIENIEADGTLNLSVLQEETNSLNIFPKNIIDVKAILGENGSGKSNLLYWITNFIMNKKTSSFGFLITSEFIIVRDKINFTNLPISINGKKIKLISPEDIINSTRVGNFKAKINKEDAFSMIGNNLMETYFKNKYLIFYSTILNQDNYYNSEGLQNSYFLWENTKMNYFDISTESLIVNDYSNHKNNLNYFISGESELLSYKYLESIRILDFLSIEKSLDLSIKFPIHTINIGFTGFNEKFWDSIDYIISPNSSLNKSIEKILRFDKIDSSKLDYETAFKTELSKEIMYCIMSFQLKNYYNFSREKDYPIGRLINSLQKNYDSSLGSIEALYNYIKKSEHFTYNNEYLINQIKDVFIYFEDKFISGEIICNGIYGLVVPEFHIRSVIGDFIKSPIYGLKLSENEEVDDFIRFNMFGFDLYGLSSGERNFLSFFSRLHSIKNRIKKNRDILFLIDEGEIGFHPQWQKEYFKLITDFIEKYFPKNRVQLIITSHSPFLASDLPKENIIFLDKDENNKTKISDLSNHNLTFASNIHSLYSDAFFIKGATIGSFSKHILNEIIDYLKSDQFSAPLNDKYRSIIKIVGEPVIKRKLEDLWIEKLGKEEELNILRDRIKYLESL